MLVPVLRVAYLAASGRFEAAPLDEQMDTSYDLERAA
jgi:hypothetical protein